MAKCDVADCIEEGAAQQRVPMQPPPGRSQCGNLQVQTTLLLQPRLPEKVSTICCAFLTVFLLYSIYAPLNQDGPVHKKQCKIPGATPPPTAPPSMSPYGVVILDTSLSDECIPMSTKMRCFATMFGYTAANPEPVYADLVDAYRLLRLGAHLNEERVSALQSTAFDGWIERMAHSGALPEWWDADVNGAGLDKYVRKDGWGSLDRAVSRDDIQRRVNKRILTLEMLVERVLNHGHA
ncbi:hypothetical protein GGX14DRAFT_654504 [Mycena pura]|uniref:Uncharacterized protein n=1 Tax=Mycena pura TaxID=153505 RepID=A0AAD6V4B1_9AGAR|nr:hypothetical protein GGX14DRAFT_654504 [Mycena pura]